MSRRCNRVNSAEEKVMAEINITPLTDIALVLLVIFMVTTPLILQAGIKVKLPKSTTAEIGAEKSINVSITAEGKVYINNREIIGDVIAQLKNALSYTSEKVIVLNADKIVPHGKVVEILDAAKKSGALKLVIATEKIK
ncbi:MAG: biopolymer transporter ExbD [Candidatus Firestonebacteria bacterium]